MSRADLIKLPSCCVVVAGGAGGLAAVFFTSGFESDFLGLAMRGFSSGYWLFLQGVDKGLEPVYGLLERRCAAKEGRDLHHVSIL